MAELGIRQSVSLIKSEISFFFSMLLAISTLFCAASACSGQPPAACDACSHGELGSLGTGGEGNVTGMAQTATDRVYWSSQRLLPSGDLVSRVPYTSMQQYYYHRPYSPLHVPAKSDSGDRFEEIYQEIESGIVEFSSESAVSKDRAFEFSDWQQYRRARLAWEAKTGFTTDMRRAPNAHQSQTHSFRQ